MRGVNKVMLIGNATREATLRHTKTGKPVTDLRIAANRTVNGHKSMQFHSVVCWDTFAETTALYMKKANSVRVEGRPEYRTFTDDERTHCGAVEIVASDVQFLGSRRESRPSNADPDGLSNSNNTDKPDVPVRSAP